MATIKSYTDLEQSRKLAEILPLESADMKILPFTDREYRVVPINDIAVCDREDEIYAWSLAALLDIIPQELFDGEYIINITEGIDDKWVITYDHHENRNHSYYSLSIGADNLVDACFEIIIKLSKLKLL
jgi:hypothetical protein